MSEPDCAKEESVRPEGVRCQLTVQSVCGVGVGVVPES